MARPVYQRRPPHFQNQLGRYRAAGYNVRGAVIDTKGLIAIAIGCTPGSGSRVLRDILDTSPQVHMDPGFDPKTKDSIGSRSFLHSKDRSPETISSHIEKFVAEIIGSIPDGRLGQYRYFGWKNPNNIRFIDLLFEILPGFRFLHLLRDPAALARGRRQSKMYRDRLKMGAIAPGTSRKRDSLEQWQSLNLPVWRTYRDQPNYLVVHYEDIIMRPAETVRAVFGWLGVQAFDLEAALASIAPPPDPISRGNGVDVSIIAEACELLGYGYRLRRESTDAPFAV